MDKTYLKLNKRLDSLTKQAQHTHNTERKAHIFHSRDIGEKNFNIIKMHGTTIKIKELNLSLSAQYNEPST
jgi:hypothetical protein